VETELKNLGVVEF